MGLNGCCVTIKYLMVIINSTFWILGLAIMGCAIWMLMDPTYLFSITAQNYNYYTGLYMFLVVGALMMIIAFLGCCGAFKESQCLLMSFLSLLLIVLAAEISAGAWAFHNTDKLDKYIKSAIQETIQDEYGIVESKTKAIDAVQMEFECCGAVRPSDWASSRFNGVEKSDTLNFITSKISPIYKIPKSCCKKGVDSSICDAKRQLHLDAILTTSIYQRGCVDRIKDLVQQHWKISLAIGIVVLLLEILGLIFSLALCCRLRNHDRYKA